MSEDADVWTNRHPVAAVALWLTTALAVAAWFFYALLVWAISANGGAQMGVAALGLVTFYAAEASRTLWPDAVRTRRFLMAAVVVWFVVWLVVAQRL